MGTLIITLTTYVIMFLVGYILYRIGDNMSIEKKSKYKV